MTADIPDLPDYRGIFDLKGKVAVVTGACGILGRHFCSGLAAYGARVAVVDLDQAACDAMAEGLRQRYGGEAVGVACDISHSENVTAMVGQVTERFGGIDVLHNNAAGKSSSLDRFFAPVEEYDEEIWREVMAVNLDGAFNVAKVAGAQMRRQGRGGSIIQTASIYGVVGPDQRIYEGSRYMDRPINTPPVYSASKAAIVGLTRHLATYWAPYGIRVNTLTPGGVESGQNDIFRQHYSARVPLGRMAQPREMVGALVWLASDASSYVTGTNVVVDGGLTAW